MLHSGFSNSHFGENPSRISCGTSRIPPPTTVGSKNIGGVNPFGNTVYLPVRWLLRHRAALPPRYPPRPEGRGLPRNLIKQLALPELPPLRSLRHLFDWTAPDFYRVTELVAPYTGHFHEYLVRGGFPQTAQIESVAQAQRLLREDIIDKVLKRDMTALFGVRRILDLEHTFLYLCMHDGGLLDMTDLCSNLQVKRPTAQHFIELLEATHLIYRLPPFGYGKDVLRARYKVYLADAAISSAVLLKGKNILDDPTALGVATETAIFRHLFARYYAQQVRFTYWRGKQEREVDVVTEVGGQIVPFEVKYRTQHTGVRELKGLMELCQQKNISRGYVVTKALDDFGLLAGTPEGINIMRLPAPLLCYWMGEAELYSNQE